MNTAGQQRKQTGNTPEGQKQLLDGIYAMLQDPEVNTAARQVATDLTKHRAFCDGEFGKIETNFETHRREIMLNRDTINNLSTHVTKIADECIASYEK